VAALFKQFADYRSGKRLRSVMNAWPRRFPSRIRPVLPSILPVARDDFRPVATNALRPGGHGLRQIDTGPRLALARISSRQSDLVRLLDDAA